jgi:hypothetical protein
MQAGPIQVVDGKETCQLVPDLLLKKEISGVIDKIGLAQWVKDTYLPPEDYFHGWYNDISDKPPDWKP